MANNVFSSLFGVAWGLNRGNPDPTIPNAIPLIQQAGFKSVKLYHYDEAALRAAADAGLEICMGTAQDQIANFAGSVANAESYIQENVEPINASVKAICVGNEVFHNNVYGDIVLAVQNLHQALVNESLSGIRVTTSITMGATQDSWPPQNTRFQNPYADTAASLLDYLGSINSFVFLDAYPFHAIIDNPVDISLKYALFEQSISVGGKTFVGLFDAQYFGFQQAIQKLKTAGKLTHIPDVYVGETGWASTGSQKKSGGQLIATVPNEKTYWNNYIAYTKSHQIPTFMFEMFDEPAKPNTRYCDPYYGIYDTTQGKFKFTVNW